MTTKKEEEEGKLAPQQTPSMFVSGPEILIGPAGPPPVLVSPDPRSPPEYELQALKPVQTLGNDNEALSQNPETSDQQPRRRSALRLALVLIGLNLSMLISALDQTITATAVPTIASELHSPSGYVWIGGAYLLANAAAGPIWAKVSDIWGRKPILLSAVAVFFGSSIICAKAVDIKMLIVGRAVQGTAAGGLIQLVIITISDIFSMRSRSLWLGLLELTWAVAGGIGPIIGGAFTEKLSWRWCFYINLPISGLTFILLLLFLDVHNPRTAVVAGFKAIDWFGSLSILGLTLMLLLGLEFGGATFPWNSPQVICLVVFGALMSVFFIFCEKRLARYPLMPMSLFANRSNVACFVLCFAHGVVFIASEYYLPLYFQSGLGASPLRSGLLVLPITTTESFMGILAGIVIHRTGRYLELIYLGTVLMTLGNGLYILFSSTTPVSLVITFQVIAGLGTGLLFSPPLLPLQALVPQSSVATATATFGFIRNLATSLSVVIGGVIFQNSMNVRIPPLSSPPVSLPSNITDLLTNGAAAAHVSIVQEGMGAANGLSETQTAAVREAFAWSMRNMWIFTTVVAVFTVGACPFIARRVLSREHVETRTGLEDLKE